MKTTDDFPRVMDRRLFLSVLAAGLLSFTGVVIETAMNVTFPTLMRGGGADKKLDSDGGYYDVIFIRAETKSLAAV
jgi:hypothetical protein